jgi:hypothetical protein
MFRPLSGPKNISWSKGLMPRCPSHGFHDRDHPMSLELCKYYELELSPCFCFCLARTDALGGTRVRTHPIRPIDVPWRRNFVHVFSY